MGFTGKRKRIKKTRDNEDKENNEGFVQYMSRRVRLKTSGDFGRTELLLRPNLSVTRGFHALCGKTKSGRRGSTALPILVA
jgi:hypothetical protein